MGGDTGLGAGASSLLRGVARSGVKAVLCLSLCLITLAASAASAQAVLQSRFDWNVDHPHFGGISALDFYDDGKTFVFLSDRGWIGEAVISRKGGAIDGVVVTRFEQLRDIAGRPLAHEYSDSEGITVDPATGVFLSFEWNHGVRALERNGPAVGPLNRTPLPTETQTNASLEALANDADGALYVIPERSGPVATSFPVWQFKGAGWRIAFEIARIGPFLPVGADIGPDGRLYVLERDFLGIGFRSRVRSFALDGSDERMILQSGLREHDNLEGISVWRDGDALVLTLVSDDNESALQQTELVEYRLTD